MSGIDIIDEWFIYAAQAVDNAQMIYDFCKQKVKNENPAAADKIE